MGSSAKWSFWSKGNASEWICLGGVEGPHLEGFSSQNCVLLRALSKRSLRYFPFGAEPTTNNYFLLERSHVLCLVLRYSVIRPARKDGAAPELFVAVADLRHCYDQIMHEPLLRRIQEVPLQPKRPRRKRGQDEHPTHAACPYIYIYILSIHLTCSFVKGLAILHALRTQTP